MNLRNILIGFGVAVTCIAFQSCSEDEKGGYTPVNYNVNGKVYITIEKYTIFQLKSIPVLIVCEDKKSYLNAG